jgi:hypothetical protein
MRVARSRAVLAWTLLSFTNAQTTNTTSTNVATKAGGSSMVTGTSTHSSETSLSPCGIISSSVSAYSSANPVGKFSLRIPAPGSLIETPQEPQALCCRLPLLWNVSSRCRWTQIGPQHSSNTSTHICNFRATKRISRTFLLVGLSMGSICSEGCQRFTKTLKLEHTRINGSSRRTSTH